MGRPLGRGLESIVRVAQAKDDENHVVLIKIFFFLFHTTSHNKN